VSPPPIPALAAFLVWLALQRGTELWISSRHRRRLRARRAVEFGRRHFPLFVILHLVFPLGLVVEVVAGGARPGAASGLWLALLIAAQGLRLASMRALGEAWNVRLLVVPGTRPIRRGIYRACAHPNYVAVVVELLAAPLIFGAWRAALAISLLNLGVLAIRLRAETRALRWAAAGAEAPAAD
jgi:methyltransferase